MAVTAPPGVPPPPEQPVQPVAATAPTRDKYTGVLSGLDLPGAEDSVKNRKWRWAKPLIEGIAPIARGGHTATLVTVPGSSEAKIIIFGGSRRHGASFEYLNDIAVLDVGGNTWTCPHVRGTPPEPRAGHSDCMVGSRIVFFGGRGAKNVHFRDLHAFDVGSMTWYQGPASGGAPAARQGHSSTMWRNHLYVFGGVGLDNKYFNTLHALDMSSMAWKEVETTGPVPSPRMMHAAVLLDQMLLIHGGFCFGEGEMKKKNNNNNTATPGPTAAETSEEYGRLLANAYLGDLRVLDLETNVWSRLRTSDTPYPPCYGHKITVSDNDLIFSGGWGKRKETKDVSLKRLRTADMTWTDMASDITGEACLNHYAHTCTAIGPHLILFGGFNSGGATKDVHVLRDMSSG